MLVIVLTLNLYHNQLVLSFYMHPFSIKRDRGKESVKVKDRYTYKGMIKERESVNSYRRKRNRTSEHK